VLAVRKVCFVAAWRVVMKVAEKVPQLAEQLGSKKVELMAVYLVSY